MTIERVAIIGLGLIGGSIGLAAGKMAPHIATTGWDADPDVRARAAERGLVATVCETASDAVADADLVVLCVPVGAMEEAARARTSGSASQPVVAICGAILPAARPIDPPIRPRPMMATRSMVTLPPRTPWRG